MLLGHGRDYAWSATSAGQDIIDTFAVPLCEPDGSAPTIDSMHYRFRGQCLPIEVLEKTNSWTPSLADDTPPGSETLHAERTKLGLVTARATRNGKPVAFTKLRSTYFHEADSALGFVGPERPEQDPRPEGLPARRVEDRLHVQLVLHRPLAHRVLQLRATTRCGRRARARTSP